MDTLNVDRDLRRLRAAAYCQDGVEVVQVLADRDPGLLLQHAGDGLIVALTTHAAGAEPATHALLDRLVSRDWDGDAELAEHLTALLGGPRSGRQAALADLDGLADLLEGSTEIGFGGWFDLHTGQCWPELVFDDWEGVDAPNPYAEPERWLDVPHSGSEGAWRDMAAFADSLEDGELGQRLSEAIDGRGAFSRFRHELDRRPEHIAHWKAFSAERTIGRARAWLAAQGYDATPGRPSLSENSAP